MNTHKHVRLTFSCRFEIVQQMSIHSLDATLAALAQGVTAQIGRKWLSRFLTVREADLSDASSRPARSPRAIDQSTALFIVELRCRRMLHSRIASYAGVSASTVNRVLARTGLSRLSDLQTAEPVHHYEHEAPGDMQLIAFTSMHLDEKKHEGAASLNITVPYYTELVVHIKRLLTDNGTPSRSKEFAGVYEALAVRHKFTSPYQPQINSKTKRFIPSAVFEWANGRACQNSSARTNALASWHPHYNRHRPHSGPGHISPMATQIAA